MDKVEKAKYKGAKARLTGIISGTVIGATVGSVVPVVGTVIGMAVGAVAGLVIGVITEKIIVKNAEIKEQNDCKHKVHVISHKKDDITKGAYIGSAWKKHVTKSHFNKLQEEEISPSRS